MVIEPQTADAFAAALKAAAEARQSVVLRGAGTKDRWGRAPNRVDVVLSTARLNRVLAHEHGDLVATVEAGAALADVNRALAARGQWLPLDPPFADRATIGGILATNDSGPLRHRYGTPRDLVIGVRVATTDGALASAGGRVVKNVAGYDLAKLVAGSCGSLAAIVSATFKLAPLPAASRTIAIDVSDPVSLADLVRDVMAAQIEATAFELTISSFVPFKAATLMKFASVPAAIDAQIEAVQELAVRRTGPKQVATAARGGANPDAVWREHADGIWTRPGAVLRAAWLPANVASVVDTIEHARQGADVEIIGRAAIGAGLLRIDADARAQAAFVERLRRSPHLSHIVVVRASDEMKSLVDPWGSLGDRERLLGALKHALDPNGILNAGRGPL